MARVLTIGDTHCPCMRKGYVDFLLETYHAWDCDRVVMIGDLVDNCSLSFHLKKPSQKNVLHEYEQALKQVEEITTAFPEADFLIGNHDALPYRWAKEVGVPDWYLLSPSDLWDLPEGWKVTKRFGQIIIDDVIYQHGDRGRASAILNAKDEFKSVVQGHHHSKAGVTYYANKFTRIFGLQCGTGADAGHQQQEYGIKYSSKPILGCGVVLDGVTGIFEPWQI